MRFVNLILSLISKLYDILWTDSSSPVPLSGILGLAAVIFGLYYYRGYAALPKRQNQRRNHPADSSYPSTSTENATSNARKLSQNQTLAESASASPLSSRLKGVHRITISVPGTLIEECSSPELSESATPISAAAHAVQQATQVADVYLLAHVLDDIGQAVVRGALEHAGVVGNGAGHVPPHRLLFCDTLDGKASIVRQLEPEIHIDASSVTVEQLWRFVGHVIEVGQGELGPDAVHAANVSFAPSLAVALSS